MPYVTTRRNFLYGGAATALAFWLRRAEAFAQGAPAPKRFLVIHHPVGTVRQNWLCQGGETDFTLSRILKPFEPVRSHMAILDGMDIVARGAGGGHEQGTVTMMTGIRTKTLYPGNGGDDPKAEGPSIDQLFLKQSPALQGTPIASLQVSCDDRVDVAEVSTRRLSYSGPGAPMDPYLVPHLTYQRVFGTMMTNASGTVDVEAMQRARMLKKSVLDFALSDLGKLRTLAPSAERERLDAHEAAIRELERGFDAAPMGSGNCGLAMQPAQLKPFTDSAANRIGNGNYETTTGEVGEQGLHQMIGELHFEVIRAAFQCDLTRVVTFQWSPGTNHVSFQGFYPPDEKAVKMHHPLSHEFNNPDGPEFLTRIDTWYSERTCAMLQKLMMTPDMAGGTLLDNTLVPYVTEVARADHSFDNTPFVVFGGANTKLKQGGLFKKHNPHRPVNDMWLACAKSFDVPMTTLGGSDMCTVPLDIMV
ncbi:MAG TPA: DUF1552 domain-containing protein [Polyangiales bacterium]|jgi:hypothetical protein|nr:DUF1552 domain-containing protein [Polyangiales bacterium]